MLTDRDFLQAQIETGWTADTRGRLLRVREPNGAPAPLLVLATSHDGCAISAGPGVPDELAARLFAHGSEGAFSDEEIAAGCERLVRESTGRVLVTSGPSYVIHPDVSFDSEAQLIRSSGPHSDSLADALPRDSGWSPEEWRLLLEGALGPWVFAMVGGEVASICHSARLTSRGAEAGVWTRAGFRRRGLAAATTAAWARLFALTGRVLFYSTSNDNVSSQRVAERLNLRQIGTIWKFDRERPSVDSERRSVDREA